MISADGAGVGRAWSASSRCFSIGLTETMIPPAFQVASIAITNCGHVLQVDREPVARVEALRLQARGERVGQAVELA